MPIIISEFHLFQVKRELLLGDSMKLNDPLLSITPESFETVDIDFSRRKPFLMINSEMPVTTEHKGIIAFEFIRIHNRSSSDRLNSHIQKRLSSNILYNLNPNSTISLVNTEDRNFSSCPSASLSLPPSSKVSLIKFDLPFEKSFPILVSKYRKPDNSYRLKNRRITQPNLLSYFPCRKFYFKELYNPEPLLIGYIKLIKPSIREIMKGISAPPTTISFTPNPVDFSASTTYTKNRAFSPTRFSEKKSRSVFRFSNKFKGFKLHRHQKSIISWCQKFYNYLKDNPK